MENSTALWMILGMGAVTYIARVLPFIVFKDKELPPFVQAVLRNIPYATLGALIFPSVLLLRDGDIMFGFVGLIASMLFAFLGANVIFVVIGAIIVASTYTYFFS